MSGARRFFWCVLRLGFAYPKKYKLEKERNTMNKVEDFINTTKLNDLLNKKEELINMTKLNELLNKKEAEEKKLRELGVDEETIQRLHTYDWAQFNKERQYLQRQVEWSPYIDLISAQDLELPVEDTESLLDSIEDIELFSLLHNVDKLTLEILFMKMDGYGSKEISEKTGLSVNAIDLRIFKLKKKLKKFL